MMYKIYDSFYVSNPLIEFSAIICNQANGVGGVAVCYHGSGSNIPCGPEDMDPTNFNSDLITRTSFCYVNFSCN